MFFLSSRLLLCGVVATTALCVQAQTTRLLTGVVRDADGVPLAGAHVQVVGTSLRTLTDDEGHYQLNLTKVGGKATLLVSHLGMQAQRVRIAGETSRDIVLQTDSRNLDEVVVTGYQQVRNRIYTGAASAVKMQDIRLEGVADVSRMLEGRVAGLNIQTISGTFGAAPRINIRGGASILGNVQPLWVIDGAVYEDLVHLSLDQLASGDAVTLVGSAIAGLNPADIQDIQVLKDASATSVYGARALNGVIVVTTKQGHRDTPLKVNYSTENSVRLRPSYRQFDLLNSQETMALYQEMEEKGYFDANSARYGRRSGIFGQWYRAVGTYDVERQSFLLPNTPEARTAFLQRGEYANTDWFRQLFTLSPTTQHSISLSGGGKHTATYASVGFYHDGGWTLPEKVNRLTAHLKNTFFISSKLTASLTAQGSLRSQQAPGTLPQRKNHTQGVFERDFDINPFSYALGTSRTLTPYNTDGSLSFYRNNWAPFNILHEYAHNHMEIDVVDFKLQAEADYKVQPFLTLKALFSARQAHTSTSHQVDGASNVLLAMRANETPEVARENIYLVRDKDQPNLLPQIGVPQGGALHQNEAALHSWLARVAVDYDRSFGLHDVKGFAFAEMRHARRTTTPFSGYGIQYDRGNQVYLAPLIFQKMADEGTDYFGRNERIDRGITFSLNGTYGFAGKYVVNGVLNYESANTAGQRKGGLWLPTWNIGAKWNIDRETFLRNVPQISKLALRLSYGLTAKMNEEAVNASAIYRSGITPRHDLTFRENQLDILHLENRDLTWEKMYEWNVGLELGLWNNRLSATLDLYARNSYDLIDLVATSGIGGQYYKYANFGDMRTQGIELGLHTQNIKTSDFSWNTSLTFSAMHQEVTRLLNAPTALDMVAGRGRGNIVGFPRGSLFSFNFDGLDINGLPTFAFGRYPSNVGEYAHIAGADFLDTQYNKTYLRYHGPIEPQITGGLSNTLTYRQWEFSFFITMQAGNKLRLNPTFDPSFADLNVFSTRYRDRWLNPGDEFHTDVPVLPSQALIDKVGRENIERAYNTYNYSQEMVADGSFVRLKNVALAYRLPQQVTKKWRLSTASLRLNVTNPLLLYANARLHGQDPEYYRSGGVALPTPRQVTLTLALGF